MPRRLFTLMVTVSVAAALVSGCAEAGPVWVDDDAAYTATTIKGVFKQVDTDAISGTPAKEAEDLRNDALIELRKRGDRAADAADLVTKTLPSTAGVPLYIEKASFENTEDALILVEIIGPEDGDLSLARLWVLGSEGDVLFSAVE